MTENAIVAPASLEEVGALSEEQLKAYLTQHDVKFRANATQSTLTSLAVELFNKLSTGNDKPEEGAEADEPKETEEAAATSEVADLEVGNGEPQPFDSSDISEGSFNDVESFYAQSGGASNTSFPPTVFPCRVRIKNSTKSDVVIASLSGDDAFLPAYSDWKTVEVAEKYIWDVMMSNIKCLSELNGWDDVVGVFVKEAE